MIRLSSGCKSLGILVNSKLKFSRFAATDQLVQARRVATMSAKPVVNVDIWSDIACPW